MESNTPNESGALPNQASGAPVESGGDNTSENQSGGRDAGLERALADLHKHKKMNRELQDRLATLEKSLQEQNSKTLREKEDWKTLYENTDKQLKSFVEDVAVDKKRSAVLNHAIKAGLINERDVDFFPLEEVKVDMTTRGKWLVDGVDELIESQKKLRPYLFKQTNSPVFNGGGSTTPKPPASVSADDVVAAELKFGKGSKEAKDAWQKYREAKLKVTK